MKMQRKHPDESMRYDFDFANKLISGSSLSAVSSITAVPTGDLTIGAGAISGTKVQATISGGVAGKIYVLTCKATTISPAETLTVQGGVSVNDPS